MDRLNILDHPVNEAFVKLGSLLRMESIGFAFLILFPEMWRLISSACKYLRWRFYNIIDVYDVEHQML